MLSLALARQLRRRRARRRWRLKVSGRRHRHGSDAACRAFAGCTAQISGLHSAAQDARARQRAVVTAVKVMVSVPGATGRESPLLSRHPFTIPNLFRSGQSAPHPLDMMVRQSCMHWRIPCSSAYITKCMMAGAAHSPATPTRCDSSCKPQSAAGWCTHVQCKCSLACVRCLAWLVANV